MQHTSKSKVLCPIIQASNYLHHSFFFIFLIQQLVLKQVQNFLKSVFSASTLCTQVCSQILSQGFSVNTLKSVPFGRSVELGLPCRSREQVLALFFFKTIFRLITSSLPVCHVHDLYIFVMCCAHALSTPEYKVLQQLYCTHNFCCDFSVSKLPKCNQEVCHVVSVLISGQYRRQKKKMFWHYGS